DQRPAGVQLDGDVDRAGIFIRVDLHQGVVAGGEADVRIGAEHAVVVRALDLVGADGAEVAVAHAAGGDQAPAGQRGQAEGAVAAGPQVDVRGQAWRLLAVGVVGEDEILHVRLHRLAGRLVEHLPRYPQAALQVDVHAHRLEAGGPGHAPGRPQERLAVGTAG